ncbi:MAG: alpha/beta hydrolase [Brevinematales bacterium]|jgi:acetyl esterase/lipase
MLIWTLQDLLKIPSLVIKVVRENFKSDKEIIKNKIYYGAQKNQYILIFNPKSAKRRNGVVFFIHGGGWRSFSPENMQFIGYFFAQHGFPTVMPGYRLAPSFKFPAQMNDVFGAFKKYVDVSEEYSLNFKKTIAAGQSAGGELAGLLAFNREEQLKYGINQDYFRGMLSISGPLNLAIQSKNSSVERMYQDYVPTEEDRHNASPIRYVTGSEKIPVLCIHGEKDPVIEINHSRSFVEKINEAHNELAELMVVKNSHHTDLARIFLHEYSEAKSIIRWLAEKIY